MKKKECINCIYLECINFRGHVGCRYFCNHVLSKIKEPNNNEAINCYFYKESFSEKNLIDFMLEGGIIESKKRGDIAYYSKENNQCLLRYDISINNVENYDVLPVIFDFKYIETFQKTTKQKRFDENLKIPLKIKSVEAK